MNKNKKTSLSNATFRKFFRSETADMRQMVRHIKTHKVIPALQQWPISRATCAQRTRRCVALRDTLDAERPASPPSPLSRVLHLAARFLFDARLVLEYNE